MATMDILMYFNSKNFRSIYEVDTESLIMRLVYRRSE